MSLNTLDSISPTVSGSESNAFQSKDKASTDAPVQDFAKLLSELTLAVPAKTGDLAEIGGESASKEETKPGQEVAASETPGMLKDMPPQWLMAPATPNSPHLMAWSLGPSMTAITPANGAPDSHSLTAFALAQGFDEKAAAWILAQQPEPDAQASVNPNETLKTDATLAPTAVDADGIPPALRTAVEISLLASQTLAKPAAAAPAPKAETNPSSAESAENLMAGLRISAMPPSWLTQRAQNTAPTVRSPNTAAGTSSQETMHSSDLDLSQVFASDNMPSRSPVAASVLPAALALANAAVRDAGREVLPGLDGKNEDIPVLERQDEMPAQSLEQGIHTSRTAENTLPGSSFKAALQGPSALERSEQLQAQAEKMGQAVGERMLTEIEKGHWHLKMMLRPATLGHIEVEMRLRNGELDASFSASQAQTRDLLQDGLSKLKETLNQMGMDVASMNIHDGSARQRGGDSTPRKADAQASAGASQPQDQPTEVLIQQSARTGQDGWDILV